jgi:protein-tyrosine-phosphatase
MEKILVVCRSNAARSQIAQAFLKRYLPRTAVRSAGTDVRAEGHKGKNGWLLRQDIVDGGLPHGLDLSGNRRGQLMQEDLQWANHVIILMSREGLEDLEPARASGRLEKEDVDARDLLKWANEYNSSVSYLDVKDIREEEGKKRTIEEVAETYVRIDRCVKDWIQTSGIARE